MERNKHIMILVATAIIVGLAARFARGLFFPASKEEEKIETNTGIALETGSTIQTGIREIALPSQEKKVINTGNNTNEIANETGSKKTRSLQIYIPDFFNNGGRQDFAQYLKDQKIDSTFNFVSLNELEKTLEGTGYDIALIPSDRVDSYSNKNYRIPTAGSSSTTLTTLFHSLFTDTLQYAPYTFLPFSIDPFVTYIADNKFIDPSNVSFNDIFQLNETYSKLAGKIIPVLFGISKSDIRFLENNQETFSNYFIVFYNILFQIRTSQNIGILNTFLELSSTDNASRNYSTFKRLLTTYTKQNNQCKDNEIVCFLLNNGTKASFGFLSYRDVAEKYFPEKSNEMKKYIVGNFPSDSNSYRVRGRGFIFNKNSENINGVIGFVQFYIRYVLSEPNARILRNNTLSAFNQIYDTQKFQPLFENIIRYENFYSLLRSRKDLQKQFLDSTEIINVLKGDFNPKIFFTSTSWKF